jgi:hypothetical protein
LLYWYQEVYFRLPESEFVAGKEFEVLLVGSWLSADGISEGSAIVIEVTNDDPPTADVYLQHVSFDTDTGIKTVLFNIPLGSIDFTGLLDTWIRFRSYMDTGNGISANVFLDMFYNYARTIDNRVYSRFGDNIVAIRQNTAMDFFKIDEWWVDEGQFP